MKRGMIVPTMPPTAFGRCRGPLSVLPAPGRPALLTLTIILPQNRIATSDSSYSRYCCLTTASLAPEDQPRHFERTVATPIRPDHPESDGSPPTPSYVARGVRSCHTRPTIEEERVV